MLPRQHVAASPDAKSVRLAPRDYLETMLPSLLAGSSLAPPKPSSGARTSTIVQLVVADQDDCDYFYTISESGVETHRGISDDVDLTLSFLSRDLGDLSENKLDVKRAVKTARIRVMGDEGVLAWLSKRIAA